MTIYSGIGQLKNNDDYQQSNIDYENYDIPTNNCAEMDNNAFALVVVTIPDSFDALEKRISKKIWKARTVTTQDNEGANHGIIGDLTKNICTSTI